MLYSILKNWTTKILRKFLLQMLTSLKLMLISFQLMMKISFSMKMMLKRIMMIMMMTKASDMQLMIPNIKILHLNHHLLNQRIKPKLKTNTKEIQNATNKMKNNRNHFLRTKQTKSLNIAYTKGSQLQDQIQRCSSNFMARRKPNPKSLKGHLPFPL